MYTLYTGVVLCNKYRHEYRSHSFVLRTLFFDVCQNRHTRMMIRVCVSVQSCVNLNHKETPLHVDISKIPYM
jgi:hypothetical protein